MDEQMFCFQCEQAAQRDCLYRSGRCVREISADTAAAQDRLTGALISVCGASSSAKAVLRLRSRHLLLMQGLFTTITNVNFDEHTVGPADREASTPPVRALPSSTMIWQQLWQEPDPDVRSLKCVCAVQPAGHGRL